MPSSTSNSSAYYPCPVWGSVRPLKAVALVLAFAAIWLAGDRLGGYLLDRVSNFSKFRYVEMYRGDLQRDYVILGSSRGVNTFYVPTLDKDTGLKGINLSYNGLDPQTIENLYSDYLLYNKAPKIMLLEISNLGIYPSTLAALKPFLGKSAALNAQHQKYYRTSNTTSSLSHLFRYNTELYYRILYYLMGSDQNWINRYKMDPALAENYVLNEKQRSRFATITAEDLEYLHRMIATSREHGVAPYLIVGPYLPGYIRQTEGYEQWLKTIEQSTGMTVLDLSESLKSIDHFADPVHTNINAVEAINALLTEHIFNRPESASDKAD